MNVIYSSKLLLIACEFYSNARTHFYFAQGDDNSRRVFASSRNRSADEPHIGKYKLLKTIGKGNFAKVKLAKHVPTGKEVSENLYDALHKIT